jgi:hypothetical protein
MNLIQSRMLKAHGYDYDGTQLRPRQAGGTQYVAVAVKNGKRAEAGGTSIRAAEHRLVMAITAPGSNRNVEQWEREEKFLNRMWRRYGFGRR